jgi:hypothetical protein
VHLVEISVMDQRYQAVMAVLQGVGRSQRSPTISEWLVRRSTDGSPAMRRVMFSASSIASTGHRVVPTRSAPTSRP